MKYLFSSFLAVCLFISCGKEDTVTPPMVELPSLSMDPLSVVEGDETKSIFVTLRLNKLPGEAVLVTLETADLTATDGEDYIGFDSKQVEFGATDVQASCKIDILGDDEFEETEEFAVRVTQIDGATITTSQVVIQIENDDENIGVLIIPETGYTTPTSYPGMNLIWSDEFDGTELNDSNWTHQIGNTDEFGNTGWGNSELQFYREENTSIVEGNLVIKSDREIFGGFNYTSSRIRTKDKFDFKYGRVDIRAVLPTGKGIWPALWLLGTNFNDVGWPACGEIDIVEILGLNNPGDRIEATCHWSDPAAGGSLNHAQFGSSYTLPSGKFDEEFHVYTLEWSPNQIRVAVDDNFYFTINTTPATLSEFRNNFFLIFNTAVGGLRVGSPNASTVFPKFMIVDYIRVFQDN